MKYSYFCTVLIVISYFIINMSCEHSKETRYKKSYYLPNTEDFFTPRRSISEFRDASSDEYQGVSGKSKPFLKYYTYRRFLLMISEKKWTNVWEPPTEPPNTGSITAYKYFSQNIPTKLPYEGCSVIRIWTLFRHGTRFPGGETIYGMKEKLKIFQNYIIDRHYTFLKNFQEGFYGKPKTDPEHPKTTYPITFPGAGTKVGELLVEHSGCYTENLESWNLLGEIITEISNLLLDPKSDTSTSMVKREEKDKPGEDLEARGLTKGLSSIGKNEMRDIGKQFRSWFSDTLPEYLDYENILIKFTDCKRTESSAQFFVKGCFNYNTDDLKVHYPVAPDNEKDPLLKFDSVCEYWKVYYKKGKLHREILSHFKKGKEIKGAISEIKNRCFPTLEKITIDDLILIYETCAFETAWGVNSPWCNILSNPTQKVFEYFEDLEYYINDGPQNEINKELGCILFQDMVKRLIGNIIIIDGKFAVDEETLDIKIATFYFTHLTAVLKFLTHLGLFDDVERLTEYDYENMENRKWKTSHIGPFSTNLTFALLECDNDDQKYILTLLQERPVRLRGCPQDIDLCPLEIFLEVYSRSIFDCRYDTICNTHKHPDFAKFGTEEYAKERGWEWRKPGGKPGGSKAPIVEAH